jgi:hypothetical protein
MVPLGGKRPILLLEEHTWSLESRGKWWCTLPHVGEGWPGSTWYQVAPLGLALATNGNSWPHGGLVAFLKMGGGRRAEGEQTAAGLTGGRVQRDEGVLCSS